MEQASDFEESLILVVDSDPVWRDVMGLVLRRMGCLVAFSESIDEGLTMAKSLRPAAIVMDVSMDCSEGFILLRILKSEGGTSHIPVIVATEHNDLMEVLALGAEIVLKKPVNHAELAGALRRVGACQKKLVVAVDNDPGALDLYERVLAPQGFHVVRCARPSKMGSIVEHTKPDLLLVNWMTALSSKDDVGKTEVPVVGVAPHPLSPRVRAELRERLAIAVTPSDGTRPSFRMHLGNALRAATPVSIAPLPPVVRSIPPDCRETARPPGWRPTLL